MLATYLKRNLIHTISVIILVTPYYASSANNIEKFDEYHVKAIYLHHFIKYVNWPEIYSSSFNTCILGSNPFGDSLLEISNLSAPNYSNTVIEIREIEQLSTCHIAYISRSETYRLKEILNYTSQKPILTISDIEGFARKRGVIEFKLRHNKVKLLINLTAANTSNLLLNSMLLEVAQIVGGID